MEEDFFENKSKKIFLLQLVSLSIFVTSFIIKIFGEFLFNVLPLLLGGFNAYLIYTENERAVTYFFGGLTVLGVVLAFLPAEMTLTVAYFVVLIIFFVVFRVSFMKKEVEGKVLAGNDEWAVLKTEFSLASGVKEGVYAVKSKEDVDEGDEVKASVKKNFGERRKPWRIKKKT